jgi:hypothetical protein
MALAKGSILGQVRGDWADAIGRVAELAVDCDVVFFVVLGGDSEEQLTVSVSNATLATR